MTGRGITVEVMYNGIKYSRSVCSMVDSILDRFMAEVSVAARELRADLTKDGIAKSDGDSLLDAALDLCNEMSISELSPLERSMVHKLDKISGKMNRAR